VVNSRPSFCSQHALMDCSASRHRKGLNHQNSTFQILSPYHIAFGLASTRLGNFSTQKALPFLDAVTTLRLYLRHPLRCFLMFAFTKYPPSMKPSALRSALPSCSTVYFLLCSYLPFEFVRGIGWILVSAIMRWVDDLTESSDQALSSYSALVGPDWIAP
jgi:hypothetical protein